MADHDTSRDAPTHHPGARKGEEVMQAYRKFILGAPEYVNGFFAFLTIPPSPMFPEHLHLKKVCGVMWVSTGPAARAEAALRRTQLRRLCPALRRWSSRWARPVAPGRKRPGF